MGKVGHHGSHNATLKEKGLELTDALQVAMIPVDHQMALVKKTGLMNSKGTGPEEKKMLQGILTKLAVYG